MRDLNWQLPKITGRLRADQIILYLVLRKSRDMFRLFGITICFLFSVELSGKISESEGAPVANFEASSLVTVIDGTIQFTDLSTEFPETREWFFEGGTPTSSTDQSPLVQYSAEGSYDVQLVVSNTFGEDTLLIEDYIIVVEGNNMCEQSSTEANAGVLFDSGGPNENYSNNENCGFLISPSCAASITLVFKSVQLFFFGDDLKVYDGNDNNGVLLYDSDDSNAPSEVTANSGELFVQFTSGSVMTESGWEASWTSVTSTDIPNAAILVSNENPPLNDSIQFTDASSQFPSQWLWDFGDGTTSEEQNPSHAYNTPEIIPSV